MNSNVERFQNVNQGKCITEKPCDANTDEKWKQLNLHFDQFIVSFV